MLCQNCHQNQATTYFKQTINGQTQELHLCPTCAAQMHLPFGTLFADDFFSQPVFLGHGKTCPTCGMAQAELQRTGRVGCADCYTTFSDLLFPYIRKLQGATAHVGPPQNHTQPVENPIAHLKTKLQDAVAHENFEEAARLRDEIRRLEEQHHA